MIMSVFMFKKVVCTIVSTLCILFLLSACDPSIDDYESYKNLKVGEHFSVNRDGYCTVWVGVNLYVLRPIARPPQLRTVTFLSYIRHI